MPRHHVHRAAQRAAEFPWDPRIRVRAADRPPDQVLTFVAQNDEGEDQFENIQPAQIGIIIEELRAEGFRGYASTWLDGQPNRFFHIGAAP